MKITYAPLTKIEVLEKLVQSFKPRESVPNADIMNKLLSMQSKIRDTKQVIIDDILDNFGVTPEKLNDRHRIEYAGGVHLGLTFLNDKVLEHDGIYNRDSLTAMEVIIKNACLLKNLTQMLQTRGSKEKIKKTEGNENEKKKLDSIREKIINSQFSLFFWYSQHTVTHTQGDQNKIKHVPARIKGIYDQTNSTSSSEISIQNIRNICEDKGYSSIFGGFVKTTQPSTIAFLEEISSILSPPNNHK